MTVGLCYRGAVRGRPRNATDYTGNGTMEIVSYVAGFFIYLVYIAGSLVWDLMILLFPGVF